MKVANDIIGGGRGSALERNAFLLPSISDSCTCQTHFTQKIIAQGLTLQVSNDEAQLVMIGRECECKLCTAPHFSHHSHALKPDCW